MAIVCTLILPLSPLAPPAAPAQVGAEHAHRITVGRTLEAAPGYPRIHVQLACDGELVTGPPTTLAELQSLQQLGETGDLEDLDDMLDQMLGHGRGGQRESDSFIAFLDTGANGYVISKLTAERFGLEREAGAIYHGGGLHGEILMHVSTPYALADSTGAPARGSHRVVRGQPRTGPRAGRAGRPGPKDCSEQGQRR